MRLRFKAYDAERQIEYRPEEVCILDGDIYLISDFPGLLTTRNDLSVFQETGFIDANGREVFEGDTVAQYDVEGKLILKGEVKISNGCLVVSDGKNERKLFDYGVNTRLESERKENV